MLGPLKTNIEFAEYLIKHLHGSPLKKRAELILLASKMVLFHANDLLDLQIIQSGTFSPSLAVGSVTAALTEIVDLIKQTLENTNIEIELDANRFIMQYPLLLFDKRRL